MLYLSKSQYCAGLQCPKQLWLKKFKPEVFDSSIMNEGVLSNGNKVGDIAKGLFGEYVEVDFNIDKSIMISKTKELIHNGTRIIAEASFAFEGNFCSVDILKNTENGIEIYEVKSSVAVSDIYKHDVAYQVYVLRKLGYKINNVYLVHLNNQYVRKDKLDLNKLFKIVDVTLEAFELQGFVENTISQLEEYMKQSDEPIDDIGTHCFNPYQCGFWKYCSKYLPAPSVFDVSRLSKVKKFKYYHDNIISYNDLLNNDVKLNDNQRLQIESYVNDLPAIINKTKIKKFLNGLTDPLYFLDFETYQQAIPLFDNVKPYMQIPFQYSLHIRQSTDSTLEHKEYLAQPAIDSRRELAVRLCQDIPDNVCVLAYNMSFEKGRIKELAALFPDLKVHLMRIHDNIQDLMIPFQKKWYYSKEMQGSYSIKYVLPTLCPNDAELDYHKLEGIHNGSEAMNAFAELSEKSSDEVELIRKNLLAYCRLDTLAMVKVLEKLIEVSE